MGKWLERVIERRDSRDKNSGDVPKNNTDNTDTMAVSAKPIEGGNDFVSLLTETERGYYLDLLGIMQSPKFGMDRRSAEREAAAIVAEYRLRKRQRIERGEGVTPLKQQTKR